MRGFEPYVLFKASNNNLSWKERVWNFSKFYSAGFVMVNDMPVKLDIFECYWTKEFKGNLLTAVSNILASLNELNPYIAQPF